jgi:hypothetical protein
VVLMFFLSLLQYCLLDLSAVPVPLPVITFIAFSNVYCLTTNSHQSPFILIQFHAVLLLIYNCYH